jgi:hypothetical protein
VQALIQPFGGTLPRGIPVNAEIAKTAGGATTAISTIPKATLANVRTDKAIGDARIVTGILIKDTPAINAKTGKTTGIARPATGTLLKVTHARSVASIKNDYSRS